METKKIENELYVEVHATNNEEETMIIERIVEEKGVYETFMDIRERLREIGKDKEWEIKLFRVRSLKSVYHNESKEKKYNHETEKTE